MNVVYPDGLTQFMFGQIRDIRSDATGLQKSLIENLINL
jgi:hypothetical protein